MTNGHNTGASDPLLNARRAEIYHSLKDVINDPRAQNSFEISGSVRFAIGGDQIETVDFVGYADRTDDVDEKDNNEWRRSRRLTAQMYSRQ